MVLAVLGWLLAAPVAAQRRGHEAAGQGEAKPRTAPAPQAPARAVPRGSDTGGTAGTRGSTGGDRASGDKVDRRSGDSPAGSGTSTGRGDTTGSRPRDGRPATGEAVPRTSPPSTGGRDTADIPWSYGGYGYGGYGFGGYYGGYYDPYGPGFGYPVPGYAQYLGFYEEGALKLKVRPRAASVYVDGYYTGIVDSFDGLFQRLRIEAGPHRIEVHAPGFESLTFDVRIEPGRTTTYHGELERIQ